jgi:hypothetical protein
MRISGSLCSIKAIKAWAASIAHSIVADFNKLLLNKYAFEPYHSIFHMHFCSPSIVIGSNY